MTNGNGKTERNYMRQQFNMVDQDSLYCLCKNCNEFHHMDREKVLTECPTCLNPELYLHICIAHLIGGFVQDVSDGYGKPVRSKIPRSGHDLETGKRWL